MQARTEYPALFSGRSIRYFCKRLRILFICGDLDKLKIVDKSLMYSKPYFGFLFENRHYELMKVSCQMKSNDKNTIVGGIGRVIHSHKSKGGVSIRVTNRGALYVETEDLLMSDSAKKAIEEMSNLSKVLENTEASK